MPRRHRPLLLPRTVARAVAGRRFPDDLDRRGEQVLGPWIARLRDGTLLRAKETSLHGSFLRGVFGDLLGYRGPTSGTADWELWAERTVGPSGKSADGALGFFAPGGPDTVLAPIELKGTSQSLDHAGGRALTPVQQGWDYANHTPGCRWVIVSNYRETRLYSTSRGADTYERFLLEDLCEPAALRRLYLLLSRETLLPAAPGGRCAVDELLAASTRDEEEITRELYAEYSDLRGRLYETLGRVHPNIPAPERLRFTQTVLDRVLFVAFAEDQGLLPPSTLRDACTHRDPYNPRPMWQNLLAVFRWIDAGHEPQGVPAYNGGLFAPDPEVDALELPDDLCRALSHLSRYDFHDDVSVEVLGHIFEQSIADLEQMRAEAEGAPAVADSRRKMEGVYYTPSYITRFVVAQTLGRTLDELRERTIAAHAPDAQRGEARQRRAWLAAWEAYREALKEVRVLDPACGSGAFLIAAYDLLAVAYDQVNAALAALRGGRIDMYEDLTTTILNNNLFGVDLNRESVEITKLSLWLRTAERGRKLTYLDRNVKFGNSVVDDPTVHPLAFCWSTGHTAAGLLGPAEGDEQRDIDRRWQGGFDVVIGNPPYVRHERIREAKPALQKQFRCYHGVADLYVYFFERGFDLLRPGGRLGFIVANKWLRAGYGEPLRRMLAGEARVERLVDFGHAPIFEDADTFPCVITVARPGEGEAPPADHQVRVTRFPREDLGRGEVPEYVDRHVHPVPQARLGAAPWNLEPREVHELMEKVRAAGVPLYEYLGAKSFRGVVTGKNEAFLVDTPTRDRLVREDPGCEPMLRRYLRGQDIDRWAPRWDGTWMIFARRGVDIDAYPAIRRHLEQYREALEPRPANWQGKRWPGRKPGSYRWYEWQDSVAYWQLFAQPKIIYQEIQFHPRYALDHDGLLLNNKAYLLPTEEPWLLAVLNAPLMWWFNWRHLGHMKDEALSPAGVKMERIPIAPPPPGERARAEDLVGRVVALSRQDHQAHRDVADQLRLEFEVDRPGNRLAAPADLSADALIKEVRRRRPRRARPLRVADVRVLQELYQETVVPVQRRAHERARIETDLSSLVNRAYGLTPREVDLLWNTAPPRMPITRDAAH